MAIKLSHLYPKVGLHALNFNEQVVLVEVLKLQPSMMTECILSHLLP